jgi:hypothetical protein
VRRCDTTIPISEYTLYQDQAEELNTVTARMNKITEAMRTRGAYPSDMGDLVKLLQESTTNDLIPVEQWTAFAEKGGLKGVVDWLPLDIFAQALQALTARRQQLIQEIFELSGISDVLRGQSQGERESFRALQGRSAASTRRMRPKQRRVQKFFRDLLRIKVEFIAEKFSGETLAEMTGVQVIPQMIAVMRRDDLRMWSVDVETDSTLAEEEIADKQQVTELFGAVSGFVNAVAPQVQAGIVSPEAGSKLLSILLRPFRLGKEVETELQQAFRQAVEKPSAADQAKQRELALAEQTEQRRGQEVQQEMQLKVGDQQLKAADLQLQAAMFEREQALEEANSAAEALGG